MQEFPNKQTIGRLRKTYPAGTRVELVSMSDPFTKLTPGEQGTVQFIDDIVSFDGSVNTPLSRSEVIAVSFFLTSCWVLP